MTELSALFDSSRHHNSARHLSCTSKLLEQVLVNELPHNERKERQNK